MFSVTANYLTENRAQIEANAQFVYLNPRDAGTFRKLSATEMPIHRRAGETKQSEEIMNGLRTDG